MTDLVARLRLEANAAQLVAETGRATTAIGGTERAVAGLGRAGATASRELGQVTTAAGGLERGMGGVRTAAGAVAGILAAIGIRELTGEIKDAAIAASGFELGLSAVAGGAAGARSELAFIRQEALRLGLDLRTTAKDYMGLAAATNGTSLAGEKTREIWLGVAEAGLAMGRSNEEVGRGLTAIQQIASKGVVSMEEIRQQLAEAIPGASNIAARALGISTAELNKLVESGKLTSEVFLPKFAAQLRSEFGPAIERYLTSDVGRARQELGRLQTALFDLKAAAGAEFLNGVIDGLNGLNNSLGDPTSVQNVRELARELGELAGSGAAAIGLVVKHADELVVILGALAGLKVGAAFLEWGTGAVKAAQGVGLLRAGIAALGGPVGILVGVAGALAVGGLAAIATSSMEASQRARELETHAADLEAALREVDASGLTAAGQVKLFGDNAAASQSLVEALTGKVGALANEYYRVAAGAKAAAVNELMAKSARVAVDNEALRAQLSTREETRGRQVTFGPVGEPGARAAAAGMGAIGVTPRLSSPADQGIRDRIAANQKLIDQAQAKALELMRTEITDPRFGGQVAVDRQSAATPTAKAGSKSNRAGNLATDLQADIEALKEHRAALAAGGQALDDWAIKDAGRQAVERAGLTHKAALTGAENGLAAAIRKSAEAAEAMKIAEERVDRALGLKRQADEDTAALQRRSAAVAAGSDALEDLRVHEAGLDAMRQIGIQTLDQLSGKDREAAESAITAAQAKERQAISTEKAERAAGAIEDLNARIRAEQLRGQVIGRGVAAEVAYARAEAIRNEVERAGKDLTAEQTIAIIEKVDALLRLQAVNDNAAAADELKEELRLLKLTRQERELEVRVQQKIVQLKAMGLALSDKDAEARARAAALVEQGALENAAAIGQLREGLREAFIRDGRLSFDDLGDYAEQRLREAVFKALLAKPIDMIINAVVQGLPAGGAVNGALGAAALASSVVGGRTGRVLGNSLSIASTGMAIGGALSSAGGAAVAGSIGGALGGGALGAGVANGLMALGTVAAPLALAAAAIYAAVKIFDIGGKPTNAGAGYDLRTGAISGNKRTEETEQAARGVGDSILQIEAAFRDAGLTLKTTVDGLVYGTRDQTQIYLSNGQTLRTAVGDATAATDAALKAVLADATYASETQKKLVESMLAAGKGFDEITAALTNYKAAQAITGQIDDAILQLSDPKAWGLEELKRAQKEQRDALKAASDAGYLSAEDFAAAGAKLDTLETLQLQAKLKELGDAAGDAASALGFQKTVQDRILELTNPTAYRVKKVNDDYAARVAEAQPMIASGALDPQILGQLELLRQLELGQLADEVNQTAKAFQDARPRLLAWIDQLRGGAASELSPKAARAEALAQYQRQLALAQANDPTALANLTGYADRLIEADRNATSSAASRLALRNQVMGDVQGLADRGLSATSDASSIAALQVPLSTIAATAAAQLEAMNGAGQPVAIGNLPSIQAMYAGTLGSQTDRLVAANDRNTQEIVASVKSLAESQAATMSALAEHLDGALQAVAAGAASQAAQIAAGLGEIAAETRLAEAKRRFGAVS